MRVHTLAGVSEESFTYSGWRYPNFVSPILIFGWSVKKNKSVILHVKMSFLHFSFPITRMNCYNISFTRSHPIDVIMLIKLSCNVNCIFWNFINTVCFRVTFFSGKTELLKKAFYNSPFFESWKVKLFLHNL